MKKFTKRVGAFAFAASMMFAGSAMAADMPELLEPATASNEIEWNAMVKTNETRIANYKSYVKQYGEVNIPSVYFDGQKVGFTDAFAVIKDGTTFMPLAAFTEATGAVIEYENATRKVTVKREIGDISFIIGSKEIQVGDKTITLSAATFEQNSRSYVPVRVLSEAFGYDVLWHSSECEVNVLDSKALMAQYATGYEVLDSLFAMTSEMDLDANYGVSGSFDVNYKSGDKAVISNTDIKAVANMDIQSYDIDTVVDFSDFDEEIKAMLAQSGKNAALAGEFLNLMKDFKIDFVLDGKTMDMYIKTNISGFVGKNIMGIDGWTSDTWIKITYADLMTEEQYAEMLKMIDGMRDGSLELDTEYLVKTMLDSYKQIPMSYFDYVGLTETMFDFVADDKFVQKDDVYTMAGDGEGYAYAFAVTVKDGVAQDMAFEGAAEVKGVKMAGSYAQDKQGTGEMTFNLDYNDPATTFEYGGETYETPEQNLDIDLLVEIFMTNEGVPGEIPTENIYELPMDFGAMTPEPQI